jgi:pimeloyl-ACP methyl ester carboxylesterase
VPTAVNGSVELHYETFGDATDPALLLVNGLGSQCIRYRVEWVERFVAAGFFTIRFDNRDVGLSTIIDAPVPDLREVRAALAAGERPKVPYLLSDMALDALAVLDAAGVERAHVMGVSMGAMIAQTMAIEHPHRMRSLTSVMSTTGDPDVGQSSPEANRLLMTPAEPTREGVAARAVEAAKVYGSPDYIDEERLTAMAIQDFERSFQPAGTARQLAAVTASGSRSQALRSVRVPTLVLHGDQDRLIDPSGGRRTAEVIPGAGFELLEGMGHDYPPAYWDRIVGLVREHAHAADAHIRTATN